MDFRNFGTPEICFLVIWEARELVLDARGPIVRSFGIVVIFRARPAQKSHPILTPNLLTTFWR